MELPSVIASVVACLAEGGLAKGVGDPLNHPGQQFVVTARQADVRDEQFVVQDEAGRAWAFVVENPEP